MSEETKKPKNDAPAGENVVGSIYHQYRAEFRKIVWPSRQTLFKHTVTVIAISLIFGAYIALMDGMFGFALQRFINFVL